MTDVKVEVKGLAIYMFVDIDLFNDEFISRCRYDVERNVFILDAVDLKHISERLSYL